MTMLSTSATGITAMVRAGSAGRVAASSRAAPPIYPASVISACVEPPTESQSLGRAMTR